MIRSRRFIGGILAGSICALSLITGPVWSGLLDGNNGDVMPPQPKQPPGGKVAPQRQDGKMDGDYRIVTFGTLGGFPFTPADQAALYKGRHTHDWEGKVPQEVKALKGQKVSVQGFMMPVDMDLEHRKIKTFVLVPHLMSCCFGGTPIMNMWVFVSTDKQTQNKLDFDDPSAVVRVYGTMDVGEKIDDDVGQSLYRLKADRLTQPKNPEL